MEDCFDKLTDLQLGTLAYHARRGTMILCGAQTMVYADGNGGG